MLSSSKKVDGSTDIVQELGPFPIDMALNHGTWASEACLEVMRRYNSNTSFRIYPTVDNNDLRQAIAKDCGVKVEHVFVANGSGPLLKTCIPHIVEKKIKSSYRRMAKHILNKDGYPLTTPRLTYSKVPAGAMRLGMKVNLLPLRPDDNFKLDLNMVDEELGRNDGMFYVVNPNNPTGNVMVTREQLLPLIKKYPESTFVVDEAYVQYIDPARHQYFSDLVNDHPNLMVMRSFSFAYGLAAARIGYVLANKELIAEFEAKLTPHRVGQISAELAMVSMADPSHLKFVQTEIARQRDFLIGEFKKYQGIQVFDSEVNYFLCRILDGRKAKDISARFLAQGMKIKTFDNLPNENYDDYFRITVGVEAENRFMADRLDVILR